MSSSQSPIRFASVQLSSQNNLQANLSTIAQAVSDAAAQGANVVVLPENACFMGKQAQIATDFNELSAWYANISAAHGVHLVAGTLPCPYRPDGSAIAGDRFRQSSLIFAPDGRQIARYDKIHLFRAQVNDGIGSYDEGRTFEAGDMPVVVTCQIRGQTLKIGMMVCFDLRFPKLAQLLRQLGADVLVAPSAFTYQTGRAHWQLLLQARALDSQCLIIGSAQGGTHKTSKSERSTWGYSSIVNASGKLLSTTGVSDTGANRYLISYADLSLDEQNKLRAALPIFDCHRLA